MDGNPHIHTDPLNGIIIARNILAGLQRVSPANAAYFAGREQDFEKRVLEATMGPELVGILTPADGLSTCSRPTSCYDFLAQQKYQGKPLLDRLGGWLKQAQVFRGKEMACYHKEWAYFSNRFKVDCVTYIEAKPGIPPTPGHVQEVIALMKAAEDPRAVRLELFRPEPDPAGGRAHRRPGRHRAGEHRRRAGRQHLLRPDEHLGERAGRRRSSGGAS